MKTFFVFFNKNFATISTIAAFLFLILYLDSCNSYEQERENRINNELALQDTIVRVRNDLGQEIAEKRTLIGSVEELRNLNVQKNSAIDSLLKRVSKLTLAAANVTARTGGSVGGRTTVASKDTEFVRIKDTVFVYIYPQYKWKFQDKWSRFDISARRDTTMLDYTIYNKFEIDYKWSRDSWFKPKYATIQITNLNPNTSTIDLQSFVVQPPRRKKWLEYVVVAAATVIIYRVAF